MDEHLYRAFAALEDTHWWFVARRRLIGQLIARWVATGSSIVDVGCGTGGFLADLKTAYHVRGIDPSPLALDACRARGLVEMFEGNATDASTWGPLPVDAVTLLDVIEHLDDDEAALRAACAAVRPAGHVIVTVPAYQWLWSEHDVSNQHRRRYTARRLRNAHQRAGLRPLQIGYFNSLLFPLAVVQRGVAKLGGGGNPLRPPTKLINQLLERVFESEAAIVTRTNRGFPFGLSVYCVSVPAEDLSCRPS